MHTYTVTDVTRGLSDLRSAIQYLAPVLRICGSAEKPGSGCLTIPREVFAYVDFLGALYSGYHGEKAQGRRVIATSKKAVRFITDIFGSIDESYRKYAELTFTMVRHGTIHVQRPHMLKRADGPTIEWAIYVGDRKGQKIRYGDHWLSVDHLNPVLLEKAQNTYLLPLALNVLYEDLLSAIDLYEKMLRDQVSRGDTTLLDNYASTVEVLSEPDDTSLTW